MQNLGSRTLEPGKLTFVVPYGSALQEARLPSGVVFYAAVRDVPEVNGGRHPEEVFRHSLTMEQAVALAESLGPRFMVSANSTQPGWMDRTYSLFRVLERTASRLSLAHFGFAEAVKAEMPRLHVSASCVMSLYESWSTILNSEVFGSICGPQYWNYDLPTMIDAVPVTHRSRVHYIVNSGCRHERSACRRHYESASARYLDPDQTPVTCVLAKKDAQRYSPRSLQDVVGTLLEHGFTSFKLEGREADAPRWQPEDLQRLVETSQEVARGR